MSIVHVVYKSIPYEGGMILCVTTDLKRAEQVRKMYDDKSKDVEIILETVEDGDEVCLYV